LEYKTIVEFWGVAGVGEEVKTPSVDEIYLNGWRWRQRKSQNKQGDR